MSQHYSIKCPNCAAPLKLIGGGRVQSVTCEYCKSLIDLNRHYQVLATFNSIEVPKLPFSIGMQGEVLGVKWHIIGWILYQTQDEPDEQWAEFLLFSVLYGYGWLVYESGELSFSRRIRDLDLSNITPMNYPVTLQHQDKDYYLDDPEPYYSVVKFVQGELNSIVKPNERIECWDYHSGDGTQLNMEKSQNELEVYLSQPLDAQEIYKSFGVKKEDQIIPDTQRFNSKRKEPAFYGLVLLAIILFGLLIASLPSKTLLQESIDTDITLPFQVQDETFLHRITLKAKDHMDLNNYQIKLYQAQKEILSLDKNHAIRNQKRFDDPWSHHAIGAQIYIKLNQGDYRLEAIKINKQIKTPLKITIQEGVVRQGYILTLFLMIILFLYYISYQRINILLLAVVGLIVMLLLLLNSKGWI